MLYNFAAENFYTKKLRSRLSLREVKFRRQKMVFFVFEPNLWGLGAMYAVHLSLIGKLVVDFLFVIIELFSLGAFILSQFTSETDRRISA